MIQNRPFHGCIYARYQLTRLINEHISCEEAFKSHWVLLTPRNIEYILLSILSYVNIPIIKPLGGGRWGKMEQITLVSYLDNTLSLSLAHLTCCLNPLKNVEG